NLTDDEKLARPAFESMRAGGAASAAAFHLPTPATGSSVPGLLADFTYAEQIVDDPALPSQSLAATGNRAMDAATAARLRARVGPGFRHAGGDAVRVRPERFAVASADTLAPVGAASSGLSASQAY